MTIKWAKGYSPELLCQKLEAAKSIDKSGAVSFHGFGFSSNVVVMNSMISFNSAIPELERKRILQRAAFSIAGKGLITPDNLLSEIEVLERQYLKEKPKCYSLITSLSVRRSFKLKRQLINNCTITFRSDVPIKYRKEIGKIKKQASYSFFGELPKDYMIAKVNVTGKSQAEAADKALDAIDLFRGIWNLFYNRIHGIRISSGLREPVNKILLGPLHTLHLPTAKLVSETWWYEPNYVGPSKIFDPSQDIDKFYAFQKSVRKLLKKSPFRHFLESAIIRYTRALDSRDWDSAFLNLWGLLETLTNTGENDTHKVTVRRTSFMYRDRDYAKQILNHLRDHRNRAVHSGSGNEDIEILMYQLKQFVELTLEFLIGNRFGLKSLDEVTYFLDQPDDIITLKNKIRLTQSALRYAL